MHYIEGNRLFIYSYKGNPKGCQTFGYETITSELREVDKILKEQFVACHGNLEEGGGKGDTWAMV